MAGNLKIIFVILLIFPLVLNSPPVEAFGDTYPRYYLSALDHVEIGETNAAYNILSQNLDETEFPRVPTLLFVDLSSRIEGETFTYNFVKNKLLSHGDAVLIASVLRRVHFSGKRQTEILEAASQDGLTHPYFDELYIRRLFRDGADTRAYELAREASIQYPDYYYFGYIQAKRAFEFKDYPIALRRFERLIELEPGNSTAYYWLARIHLFYRDRRKARQDFGRYKALSNDPIPWSSFYHQFQP